MPLSFQYYFDDPYISTKSTTKYKRLTIYEATELDETNNLSMNKIEQL